MFLFKIGGVTVKAFRVEAAAKHCTG